jgi:hypothetical protein
MVGRGDKEWEGGHGRGVKSDHVTGRMIRKSAGREERKSAKKRRKRNST